MSQELVAERLRTLGELGGEAVPLVIEAMAPEDAIRESRRREGSVFRLQEVAALLSLGREDEAARVLSGVGALQPGLEAQRALLEQRFRPAEAVRGRSRPKGAEAELGRWLERVQSWRRDAVV